MQIPTPADIKALHVKYAPGEEALTSVWSHCQIVQEISLQIAARHPHLDPQLLEAGALLHDIGVYKLYVNGVIDEPRYITHGLLGYQLLKEEGFHEALCRFALLHTGVGITRQDVEKQKLPLPSRDYIAETAEERTVMYADKFHSKTNPPTFNSATWYAAFLRAKFGDDKARQFEALVEEFGEPGLKPLIAKYGQAVR